MLDPVGYLDTTIRMLGRVYETRFASFRCSTAIEPVGWAHWSHGDGAALYRYRRARGSGGSGLSDGDHPGEVVGNDLFPQFGADLVQPSSAYTPEAKAILEHEEQRLNCRPPLAEELIHGGVPIFLWGQLFALGPTDRDRADTSREQLVASVLRRVSVIDTDLLGQHPGMMMDLFDQGHQLRGIGGVAGKTLHFLRLFLLTFCFSLHTQLAEF